MKATAISISLLLFGACSGVPVDGSLSPSQRSAIEAFMRENPDGAIVQTSDCISPDLGTYINEHPSYHPYFAEGDFTRDGSPDFVIATRSAGAYDLWLFPGAGFEYGTPQNFATITWLHDGGFQIFDRNLFVGPFNGEGGNLYSWDAQLRRFTIASQERP